MLMFLMLVSIIGRFGLMGGGAKGAGGAKATNVPKLIVDNEKKMAPFIDATGHGSAQLFGSIAWDPLQTGGLGTPEHQRVTAGDVHRANLGILFIDEIKNLNPDETVTLLTVLEDGQLPVTLRSRWDQGNTAAMAVSTEPIPCMCFLVGAGNFDSIGQLHPALMDRIYGYGKVVRMNNDMPNTVDNRRRYVQFVSQEVQRFHLVPFSRDAVEEIVDEGRRRSNKRDALTTRFRPMIAIVKTAATLAMLEGLDAVERRHVKDAIEKHCKTIQKQILEHQMSERGQLLEIQPEGARLGQIYGVAVVTDPYSGEITGNVLTVKGLLEKRVCSKEHPLNGYYNVTGIARSEKQLMIADSVAKVRSVILQKYGVDIAQDFFTHIDFAQAYGVDGPSAGVTMAILLCSLMEGKPIRQDVVVTGEINVGVDGIIQVTAVGGLHEKIKAAEAWGFKKVVIPAKNYKHSVDPRDYCIDVVAAETLEDYLKECFV
jgi:Lon-like ATP-dependent protease